MARQVDRRMTDDHDTMPTPRPSPFVAAMVREKYESKLMISAYVLSKDPKFKEPKWVSEILDATSLHAAPPMTVEQAWNPVKTMREGEKL